MKGNSILLGEIVTIQPGFAFDAELFSEQDGLPLIRVRDVARGYSKTYYSGEYPQNYLVKDGDLLISMDGEFRVGRWQGGKALLNQRVCRIVPDSNKVDKQFLFYFLPRELKKIEDSTPFATVKHLSGGKIAGIQVHLPSLEKQRRIAAILDKADSIRRKRDEIVSITHKLAQSEFVSMFGHPGRNENGYPRKRIGDLCQRCDSINPTVAKLAEDTFRYIELGSVDGKVGRITGAAEFVGREAPSRARQVVHVGDVLVATVRPNLRGTALVGKVYDGVLCSTGFCVLRPEKAVSSNYLYQITRFPWFSEQLAMRVRGANYPAVTDKDILSVDIPLPPITLQHRYDLFVSKTAALVVAQEHYLREAESLFSSLQQNFFSVGETNA